MVQGEVRIETRWEKDSDVRTNKIVSIKTDKGRICIAGVCFSAPKKLLPYDIGWIKNRKLLQIVDTKWITVGGVRNKDILYMVQLNLNPINLFWIVFWIVFWKVRSLFFKPLNLRRA